MLFLQFFYGRVLACVGGTLPPSNQAQLGCGMPQAWSRDWSKCTGWTRQPCFGTAVVLDTWMLSQVGCATFPILCSGVGRA